jgi:hypothetical protein
MHKLSTTDTRRTFYWTAFKAVVGAKNKLSQLQYDDLQTEWHIWAYDGPEILECRIWSGAIPASAINDGYTQAQNDSDKSDWTTSYQSYSNKSLVEVYSPLFSGYLTNGGSVNLAANGAVTPLVFTLVAGSSELRIDTLSLILEFPNATNYGDKFVTTSIGALTNGMLLEAKSYDNLISPWQNMRRTRDLIEIADSVDVLSAQSNLFRVNVRLPSGRLVLARSSQFLSPDFVRITVRDNLTAFSWAEAYVQGVTL